MKCVSLTLHCSCTPAHVVWTPADDVTSALAQVLSTFNLAAEQMVGVEQANRIVSKQRELETEQNIAKDLFKSARAVTGG